MRLFRSTDWLPIFSLSVLTVVASAQQPDDRSREAASELPAKVRLNTDRMIDLGGQQVRQRNALAALPPAPRCFCSRRAYPRNVCRWAPALHLLGINNRAG